LITALIFIFIFNSNINPIIPIQFYSFTLFIMQFSVAIITLLGAAVSALPTEEKRQVYTPCSGLYGTSQCCATDVLGVADLDCGNRKSNIQLFQRLG
jgi:hypothetical protein